MYFLQEKPMRKRGINQNCTFFIGSSDIYIKIYKYSCIYQTNSPENSWYRDFFRWPGNRAPRWYSGGRGGGCGRGAMPGGNWYYPIRLPVRVQAVDPQRLQRIGRRKSCPGC